MVFVCNTRYSLKALSVMSRMLRKTVRVRLTRWLRAASWMTIGLCLLSIYIAWGDPWRVAVYAAVVILLILVAWKGDVLNGFVAKRKALPGTEFACTTFRQDCFVIQIAGAVTQWQYDRINAMAESKQYILFAMGKNHAIALDKQGLEGGSVGEFRRFLEEQTGKRIEYIGG